jgi:hypothetical protein
MSGEFFLDRRKKKGGEKEEYLLNETRIIMKFVTKVRKKLTG